MCMRLPNIGSQYLGTFYHAKGEAFDGAKTYKLSKDRQIALDMLLKAIRKFRKHTDEPLTLRGSDYAHAVQELNKAIDRAEGLLL